MKENSLNKISSMSIIPAERLRNIRDGPADHAVKQDAISSIRVSEEPSGHKRQAHFLSKGMTSPSGEIRSQLMKLRQTGIKMRATSKWSVKAEALAIAKVMPNSLRA